MLEMSEKKDQFSWCVPIVLDNIRHEYYELTQSKESQYSTLTSIHGRLWQKILEYDFPTSKIVRKQLLDSISKFGISASIVDKIDKTIYENLLTIMLRRLKMKNSKQDSEVLEFFNIAVMLGELRANISSTEIKKDTSNIRELISKI